MSTNVRFYLSHEIKINFKSNFWAENIMIFTSFVQRYNGRHYAILRNLLTTNGLLILLHGVVSLPDETSCDN